MIELILGIVVLIFVIVYAYLKRAYSFWEKLNVTGPKPKFPFGNLKKTILSKRYLGDEIADIYHEFSNQKVVGIYMATAPILLVRDLDIVKHVLLKDYAKFSSRGVEVSEEELGTNLFHADGDTWNILRKRMVPVFSTGKTKKMFYLINDCANSLVSFVDKRIDSKQEWQVGDLTARYLLSITGACIFGFESDWWSEEKNIFFEMADRVSRPSWKVFLDMLIPGSMKKLNLGFFDKDVCEFFKDLGRRMVIEREGKPKVRHDFIDLMLELKEEAIIKGYKIKSNEEITLNFNHNTFSAQIALLFAASYDTTSSTLSFLLRELSLNPEIQDKVISEVDRVYEQFDGIWTYEAVGELKYMDMVFYETLRLYPILDPLQRKCNEDYKIPGTDVVIPKGTIFFVSSEGIHKDPKHWSEPNIFMPERFLKMEHDNNYHPMRFLSFGEGPRICIGNKLASVVARVGLAKFLRHYRVESCEKTVDKTEYSPRRFTRHAEGGVFVNIVKRNH